MLYEGAALFGSAASNGLYFSTPDAAALTGGAALQAGTVVDQDQVVAQLGVDHAADAVVAQAAVEGVDHRWRSSRGPYGRA